jgi:hypothetical protein
MPITAFPKLGAVVRQRTAKFLFLTSPLVGSDVMQFGIIGPSTDVSEEVVASIFSSKMRKEVPPK